jgi:hypothetical protein
LSVYRSEWSKKNRERIRDQQRARYAAEPEKYRQYFRNHRIERDYGLTEIQYAEWVQKQNGKCAICGKEPSGLWHGDRMLNVDHNHETGAVRGLLCNRCNRGLGLVGDTVESIGRVLAYLQGEK